MRWPRRQWQPRQRRSDGDRRGRRAAEAATGVRRRPEQGERRRRPPRQARGGGDRRGRSAAAATAAAGAGEPTQLDGGCLLARVAALHRWLFVFNTSSGGCARRRCCAARATAGMQSRRCAGHAAPASARRKPLNCALSTPQVDNFSHHPFTHFLNPQRSRRAGRAAGELRARCCSARSSSAPSAAAPAGSQCLVVLLQLIPARRGPAKIRGAKSESRAPAPTTAPAPTRRPRPMRWPRRRRQPRQRRSGGDRRGRRAAEAATGVRRRPEQGERRRRPPRQARGGGDRRGRRGGGRGARRRWPLVGERRRRRLRGLQLQRGLLGTP